MLDHLLAKCFRRLVHQRFRNSPKLYKFKEAILQWLIHTSRPRASSITSKKHKHKWWKNPSRTYPEHHKRRISLTISKNAETSKPKNPWRTPPRNDSSRPADKMHQNPSIQARSSMPTTTATTVAPQIPASSDSRIQPIQVQKNGHF